MKNTIDFLFPLKDHLYSAVYDQVVTKIKESKDDNIHWCQSSDGTIDDEEIVSIAREYFSDFCPNEELF